MNKEEFDITKTVKIKEANALVKEMVGDIDTVLKKLDEEYNEKRAYYESIKTRLNYIWENDQINYEKKAEMLTNLKRELIVKFGNPRKLLAVQILAAFEIAWKCIIWPRNIAFMLILAIVIDYILEVKIYPMVPLIILINWLLAAYMIYRDNKEKWR